MTRRSSTIFSLALFMLLPLTASTPADATPAGCHAGSINVQWDPTGNEHDCEGGCTGQVVVQVGLENETDCDDGCTGNLIVQAGAENHIGCGTRSALPTAFTAAAFLSHPTSIELSCPPELPDANFFCFILYDDGRPPEDLCDTALAQLFCDSPVNDAWVMVWYYPPGAYQAWCFATGECPCPHCPTEDMLKRTD